jgi:CheY-like chemotaxis protein
LKPSKLKTSQTLACALLVDDDPDDLVLLGRALHKLGVDVTSASVVSQAESILTMRVAQDASRPFDIAFIDIKLVGSNGDGLRVANLFRQLAPSVPVVIVTAYEHPGAIAPLLGKGFVELAFKPVETETLKLILDRHKIDHV